MISGSCTVGLSKYLCSICNFENKSVPKDLKGTLIRQGCGVFGNSFGPETDNLEASKMHNDISPAQPIY